MVRWIRSAQIARGKNVDAMQWSREATAYVNKKFPEAGIRAYQGLFGPVGRLVWMSDSENLADLEKISTAIGSDEGYLAFVAKSSDLFVEGSMQDDIIATFE